MFAEELDEFLDTDEHAVAAFFNGGSTAIAVLFSEPGINVLGIASTNPTAIAKTADVPSEVGKTLAINGVAFTIIDSDPIDDGAFITLQLQKP